MTEREPINASNIGLWVGFEECPRYLKQSMGPDDGVEEELGVFLSEAGNQFEEDVLDGLREEAAAFINAVDREEWNLPNEFSDVLPVVQQNIADIAEDAMDREDPTLVYQPSLWGRIDAWPIKGQADLIAFWPEDRQLNTHILEIKSSTEDQPYHQIQAAIYSLLLRRHLQVSGFDPNIDAGIVHRESDEFHGDDPESFPAVPDLSVVEGDVRRMLREDGKADQIASEDSVNYRLSGKCNYCLYSENCFSHAIKSRNLALLGLTEGEQRVLNNHDIEDITQLARLKEVPDSPQPDNYQELTSQDEEKVRDLLGEPVIGDSLDEIVQRAQAVLGGIIDDSREDEHPEAATQPWIRPLQGSGKGTLPEDDPTPGQQQYMDYQSGELIRCYIYVREDYMRDSIAMLAGRVARTNSPIDSLSFSAVTDNLPDDTEEQIEVEGELLADFFEQLFQAVDAISSGDEEATVHLYFFSRMERDALVDGVKRHIGEWDAESFGAIRDLLGLRQAIDQPMVSILQDELQDRFSLQYTSTGLLPILDQAYNDECRCGCGDEIPYFETDQWTVEREDNTVVDLWSVFSRNFFNYRVTYRRDEDGEMVIDPHVDDEDGWYPARARFDDQLPLEYIWAALGKLDTDWANSNRQEWEIHAYKWHDAQERETPITPEDIGLLGEKICQALEHLEHSLSYYHNPFMGKSPIPLPDIPNFDLGQSTLRQASQDYVDLEHFSDRQDSLRHYAKSPRERVRTGKSAIVKVERTEMRGDDLIVYGTLVYDDREFANENRVANSCRLKGSEGTTSGSRRVANVVEWDKDDGIHRDELGSPRQIERGVPVEVSDINIPDREIELHLSDFHSGFFVGNNPDADFDYIRNHRTWTSDPTEARDSNYDVYFGVGDKFILDPQTDDWTAEHGASVFDHLEDNPGPFYQTVAGLLEGEYE